MPSTAAAAQQRNDHISMETPMLERVKASIRFAATEYTSVMTTPKRHGAQNTANSTFHGLWG